eukprot:763936-Hanusia_phi.AAC.3
MEPESTTSNEMVDDGPVVDRPSLKEDVNTDDVFEAHRPPSEPTQIEQDMPSPRQALMNRGVMQEMVAPDARPARFRYASSSRSHRSFSGGSASTMIWHYVGADVLSLACWKASPAIEVIFGSSSTRTRMMSTCRLLDEVLRPVRDDPDAVR